MTPKFPKRRYLMSAQRRITGRPGLDEVIRNQKINRKRRKRGKPPLTIDD